MANATKPRYWHINLDMSTEMEFDQMSQPRKAIIKLTAEHKSFASYLSSEPQGTILLVMQDKKPKMLCKMIDDAPHTKEEAKEKGVYSVKRKVEIIGDIPSDWQDPKATWFRQRCGDCTSRSVQQYPYIQRILDHLSKTDPMPHMSEPAKKPVDGYNTLLREKKNIILQGAPGVGKTYTTASIAVRLCNPNFSELEDHTKVMEEYERLRKSGQIAFCTFHQSMDYEDFVEGVKPELQGEHITYNVEGGIFKQICEQARTTEGKDIIACIDDYLQKIRGYENRREIPTISGKSKLLVWWEKGNKTISTRSTLSQITKGEQHSPSPLNIEKVKAHAIGEGVENNWPSYARAFIKAVKDEYHLEDEASTTPHVLIIDEINRGNISRIFGELITLLEADKRTGDGKHPIKVTLPYSKDSFSIPSNLYIIGTMNTTDRSTGSIDYAVRRRFAFITLKTDPEVIKTCIKDDAVRAKALALFKQINDDGTDEATSFIATHKAGDFDLEDLKVGHSYFLAETLEALQMKMRYEVIPLLREYIKDGILQGKENDEKYFAAWEKGECFNPATTEKPEASSDSEA